MATILERSQISPALDSAPEFSLPIVFFDMVWYGFAANQSVLFFEFPCSKSHFVETIIPDLKSSLSLTLSQFLPLAGNIIHPLNPGDKLVLRYETGNSVSFTVSESTADLNHLVGNDPRVCDEFYAFAPHLPPATNSESSSSCPVLALQVTLFPGQGLCIGFVTHHAVADASTVVSFMQAWALINRSKPNRTDNIRDLLTEGNLLQFYDRKAVTNINGLDDIYWHEIVECSCPAEPPSVELPINKLRATFVLKKEDIQRLKNFVLAKCPNIGHLSSFTIICALVWVCSAKSAAPSGEHVPDDEPEYFGFVADCRGRLNPPLPANYFGNCVALVKAELNHGEVKGNDGFVMAAKAIGEAIKETVYSEKGVLYGAEKWPDEYGKLVGKRQYGVAGSPRFNFYAVDYGWGKPKKFEALFIDGGGSISLCKSRDFEGGLEIGLSKPKVQMDAFTTVFKEILESLLP
ncbi:anthocyanidin 3-O-glucoside 6''-O-acyltransferase [Sesamum indicum]|uniref:Anthocyanidin 3-O-glucoside 6''-O-acyltransferase n=1 Tax=Sesamum indicum TaxID=4182 RepID=A0A6I9T408_SESIN|nr:anthocyanidin 3-O-glucoside 6''-O-acyltransferase [Sesamum indicum]